MRLESYAPLLTREYMMGPNTLRLLREILEKYPIAPGGRTLDLGCGTGLSSLCLARETKSAVFATDLWISASDNLKRFIEWGVDDTVIPIHADANALPYADEFFDTVVSIDAYHYFACNPSYFREKLLPLLKKGGCALIVVPGLHTEFTEPIPAEMLEWAGEEYRLFHSCDWWRATIGNDPAIASANFFELADGEVAWQEWFDSGHKYALSDKAAFDRGVDKYMTFVGIAVRKKC